MSLLFTSSPNAPHILPKSHNVAVIFGLQSATKVCTQTTSAMVINLDLVNFPMPEDFYYKNPTDAVKLNFNQLHYTLQSILCLKLFLGLND